MKKCRKQASFTVEASLIFPFLLFLLAIFIQLLFYLHDASIFVSAAYEAAQKSAAMRDMNQKELETYAEGEAKQLLKGKRFACSSYTVQTRVSDKKIRIQIEGRTGFFQGVSFCVEKEVLRINPITYLRNSKKVKGLWNMEE